MEAFDPRYVLWATSLGALSALSLLLGSAAGLLFRPGDRTTGTLAAFGAGALIAALAIGLVAPSVAALRATDASEGAMLAGFWALIAGALAGGSLFVVLDQLVNARGGFLRKSSTLVGHLHRRRKQQLDAMLRDLCTVSLLRNLPPEQIGLLVRDVRPESFADGAVLFREGEPGDRLFFVRSGELELSQGGRPYRTLRRGDVVGELALLTHAPRALTARVRGDVETLVLRRADFEQWRAICPELDHAVRELAGERLAELAEEREQKHEEARRWAARAIAALQHGAEIPTPAEIRQVSAQHSGAPLAIWLGMVLDGIPESFVIGSGLLTLIGLKLGSGAEVAFGGVIPYTLVAGLFLSNFPEAMSSSVGMRKQGWSARRVLLLWASLLVLTAVGAGVGCLWARRSHTVC